MEILLAFITVLVLILVIVTIDTLSWGFLTYKFYYWFILPIFVDLPQITLYEAIGLVFFISLFKNHNIQKQDKKQKENENYVTSIFGNMLTPWVLLFIGYLFKSFML